MILEAVVKPVLDSITGLVSQFHLSPDDRQKFEQQTAALMEQAKNDAANYDVQLNQIASQNIQADAKSGDKLTQRGRPAFLYVFEAILAVNYIVIPLSGLHKGTPILYPDALLALFGTVILGEVTSRTVRDVAGMPGDSSLNVLGGLLKMGQKS